MAENAAALRAGAQDAVQLFQPYVEELVASGVGHIWYAAADRGPTAYTTLVTRRPLLQSRHDDLLRMVRAMAHTLRWIGATSGAEIAGAVAEFFPAIDRNVAAAAIERYRGLRLFATDPVLRREGFDRLQAAMLSGSALDHTVAFERCVDNSLAEQALADSPARP
jgi:NitT/TauT family transport system substrate-binding protein